MPLKLCRPPRLSPAFAHHHLKVQLRSPPARTFSSTFHNRLRTTELQTSYYTSLRANPERLWNNIHSTAQWGAANRYGDTPTSTGLSRLTLSDHDKAARDWFVQTTTNLGCSIQIDEIGNIFAIRPGLKNDVPATFVGSHLDSQPAGGRFDGVLGVCAGVEMLEVLNERMIETEGPVGVVNWTNEEGARFPVSMMGSGVWAGARGLEEIYDLKEVGSEGKTVKQELDRLGYTGNEKASASEGVKMAGHFEVHIEQGPTLYNTREKIGVVSGVQAYKWFEIEITGRSCHSGTTALEDRADALLFAGRLMVKVREIAKKARGLASVGVIETDTRSVNTVPEKVKLTLDVRHGTDAELKSMITTISNWIVGATKESNAKMKKTAEKTNTSSARPKLRTSIREIFSSPKVDFHPTAIQCITESAKNVLAVDNVRQMLSGAGHDSVNTSKYCPTGMIFVPCRAGISHHPQEWSRQEHCASGTDVLIESVLRFDKWRHEQGHFAD